MSARICRWYDGKTAALSFRFDDSHPTHIEKAAPMLNEFNLVGTFLINPGREGFQQHRETWENDIVRQGHELGDHTMLHRGATSDSDAEEQIGRCAEHIWRVQPDKSKLLAFQRGGATVWLQRKPFEYFLARYHLFEPGRSMSCSEAYKQFSLNAYKKSLRQAIRSGEWMETHFHGIDATHLHISTATFRDILAHSYSRGADLWQAGMAAIHKYQEARDASHLIVQVAGPNEIRLHLTCVADPELFDQPLTLEVDLPPRVRTIKVSDKENSPLEVRIARQKGGKGCPIRHTRNRRRLRRQSHGHRHTIPGGQRPRTPRPRATPVSLLQARGPTRPGSENQAARHSGNVGSGQGGGGPACGSRQSHPGRSPFL